VAEETTTTVQTGEEETTTTPTGEETQTIDTSALADEILLSVTKPEGLTSESDDDDDEDDYTSEPDEDDEKVEISKAELARLLKNERTAKKHMTGQALKSIKKEYPDADHERLVALAKDGANKERLFVEARRDQTAFNRAAQRFAGSAKPVIEAAVKKATEEIYAQNGQPHIDVVTGNSKLAQLEAELADARTKGTTVQAVAIKRQIHELQQKQRT
jgi:nitroreductase